MWWFALMACGGALQLDVDEPEPEACEVESLDAALTFEVVIVGESQVATAAVRNPCEEAIVVDALVEGSGDFTLVDDSVVLEPGELGALDVVFAPTSAGDQEGAVLLETHGGVEVQRVGLDGLGLLPPDNETKPALLYVVASFGVTRTHGGGGMAVPYEVDGVTHPVSVQLTLAPEWHSPQGARSCTATWVADEPVPVFRTGKGWMYLVLDLPAGFEVEHDCVLAEGWPPLEELLDAWQWGVAMSPLTVEHRTLLEDLHPPTWWQVNGDYVLSGGFHASFVPVHPVHVAPVDLGWAWVTDEELRVLDLDGGLWDGEGVPARYTAEEFQVGFVDEMDPYRPAVYVLEALGAVDASWLL